MSTSKPCILVLCHVTSVCYYRAASLPQVELRDGVIPFFLYLFVLSVWFCCRITGTPQQLPRALEILSQHFRANPPREKPGGAPPAVAALLVRPGVVHMTVRMSMHIYPNGFICILPLLIRFSKQVSLCILGTQLWHACVLATCSDAAPSLQKSALTLSLLLFVVSVSLLGPCLPF